ncbi:MULTISPECIES: hypothetical protein [Bacillus]|uniref:Uncharacterized protein n=1 Tax=Bacillus thuringiensis TaxID=1428 RepID=A0A9X7FWR7_BACTU|nr:MULTISPECIES: hypothetical protein [Bacillus]MCQ6334496.1 hypothetical protein [Bacillus cereus]KIQ78202.1 hypothetical protein RW25_28170 [Bacillus sp. L_1B0_8]KIQ78406.1 hypothetical protein RT27_29780 [Bacillus sp. L_1B0_5]MCU7678988.1 hypothetical protein [Bacillus thuringiensis]PFK85231.1 hypothetical protein COJ04_25320 [Bacillus thuringiensis]
MNENKRNMILSFIISIIFIFASLLSFSSNEYVYVILKIGAAAGVINIVMMSVFLYFQREKTGNLLN